MAAAVLAVPLLFVALRCAFSPEVPFLRADAAAPWIAPPAPVSAELRQWGRVEVPVARFALGFRVEAVGPAPVLALRSLGDAEVRLDGRSLATLPRSGARGLASGDVALAGTLAPGPHLLEVRVRNGLGPPLLSLRSRDLEPGLSTAEGWSVRVDAGPEEPAVAADDTRIHPLSLALESPAEALWDRRNGLLLLFVTGALASLGLGRGGGPSRVPPLAAPLAASAAWLWFYVAKAARIPALVGFDARHHLEYVDLLLETGRLPLAGDGWSTYHPPLFYALAAAVARLGGGEVALKALPAAAGLAGVWVAWLLARRLFPDSPRCWALAVLFAGTLPVNLYSAAYFSNESLHAALGGAALLAGSGVLLAARTRSRDCLAVGGLFALAALSKFTVLVIVPVCLALLAWKLVRVERVGAGRATLALGSFSVAFLLLAGWFYLRNQLHFGTPLVGNWSLPGEAQRWWQQPGFHTVAYYLGFGEALVHPYLSGFHSFWDALYSTFWGDGFVAGRADPTQRHAWWDYGHASAVYLLALPATALLGVGLASLAGEALAAGASRRGLALALQLGAVWAVALAFAALTVELPFFAQAKAAYLLVLTAPLAAAFAAGFSRLDALARRGPPLLRAALYGWLASWSGAQLLAYLG